MITVWTDGFFAVEVKGGVSLFKYLPFERADVLRTCRIRYSQPATFNDPFEGKPFFSGLAPSALMQRGYPRRFQKVLADQYASMPTDFRARVPFDAFREDLEYLRPEIYKVFESANNSLIPEINQLMHTNFSNGVGVLSLSEVSTVQLMWSHYARSHTGFVLEFDEQHPYFSGISVGQDDLWQLHKVIYAERRPSTTVIDLDFRAILLTKHVSWNYEREWKHFRPLNQATEVIETASLPVCLFEIPATCLRSVIVGAKMDRRWVEMIIRCLDENPAIEHIELREAVLDERDYSIQTRPFVANW